MKIAILLLLGILPQDDVEQLKKRIAELTQKLEAQEKRIADLEKKLEFLALKGKDKPGDTEVEEEGPKHPWAGFKKGDFAFYKTSIETAGMKMETGTRNTIKEVTEDKVMYETETTMTIGGRKQVTRSTAEVPLKVEAVDPKAEKPESGVETIEVPAGKFKCKWTRVETGGNTTKIWMSNKVPGGLVKMEMDGASTMKMELQEYKGK